ncbi:MAG: hypothetical protein ACQESP_00125 [Candidatus Muiribacteriota bacterium]
MKFYNDGWYGKISDDFIYSNIKTLAKAIAKYIISHDLAKKKVIIGYDSRFLSYEHAQLVAEVLMGNKLDCCISDRDVPSVFTAATLKSYKGASAVHITGQNQKYFNNGLLFFPEYAGPPFSHISMEIERNIRLIKDLDEEIEIKGFQKGIAVNSLQAIDFYSEYAKCVNRIIDLKKFKDSDLKIVVDYMNGSMRHFLNKLVPRGVEWIELNHTFNPYFNGIKPDPVSGKLEFLVENIKNTEADFGVAFDSDGGNICFIDSNGQKIHRDILLGIVLEYIIKNKTKNGIVVKTNSTTSLVDEVCQKNGVEIEETYSGFRHIVERLIKNKVILGADNSGGITSSDHVPVKDSVLFLLYIIEIMSLKKKSLTELVEEFNSEYGQFYSKCFEIKHNSEEEKLRIISKLKKFSDSFREEDIKDIYQTDGLKMIFKDKSWFYIRIHSAALKSEVIIESQDKNITEKLQNKINKILKD